MSAITATYKGLIILRLYDRYKYIYIYIYINPLSISHPQEPIPMDIPKPVSTLTVTIQTYHMQASLSYILLWDGRMISQDRYVMRHTQVTKIPSRYNMAVKTVSMIGTNHSTPVLCSGLTLYGSADN